MNFPSSTALLCELQPPYISLYQPNLHISLDITPYLTKSPHISPYHLISHYITPYLTISPYISLYHLISHYITPYLTISPHISLYHPISHYITPYLTISLYHPISHYITPIPKSHYITPYLTISHPRMNLLQKSGITDFHLKNLIAKKLTELKCPEGELGQLKPKRKLYCCTRLKY